jgi:hypothetical protein
VLPPFVTLTYTSTLERLNSRKARFPTIVRIPTTTFLLSFHCALLGDHISHLRATKCLVSHSNTCLFIGMYPLVGGGSTLVGHQWPPSRSTGPSNIIASIDAKLATDSLCSPYHYEMLQSSCCYTSKRVYNKI